LGSVLLDGSRFPEIAVLIADDFAIEKHRRIYQRMCELHERGEKIDHVTVAEELARHSQLESVDGVGYLVSLDDGMPHISNLDSYVRIVRDKCTLRRIVHGAQHIMNRALSAEDDPELILSGAEETLLRIRGNATAKTMSVADVPLMETFPANKIEWLLHTMIAAGTVTLITGDSGSGKSSLVSAICSAISRGDPFAGLRTQRRPVLYLDRENGLPITLERFGRLGIKDSTDFKVWGGWCASEPPTPWSPPIIQWVKSCELKPVIVVDSFGAFSNGADENDAAQVRAFMDGPRRLANMGATMIALHNSSAKTDTAKDFRGSTAFKDSIDVGYSVRNRNPDPLRLGPLCVSAWKGRLAVAPEIVFNIIDGEFMIDSRAPAQIAIKAFRDLLIANPGIGSREFQALAVHKELGRNKARDFIRNGIAERTIHVEEGPTHNQQRHTWAGSLDIDEVGSS
jgi:archaellum biogenesis ATPase FlaH